VIRGHYNHSKAKIKCLKSVAAACQGEKKKCSKDVATAAEQNMLGRCDN